MSPMLQQSEPDDGIARDQGLLRPAGRRRP
jgi:hypothetical protein